MKYCSALLFGFGLAGMVEGGHVTESMMKIDADETRRLHETKEVYFFVGPRQAGVSSIEKFFTFHASAYHPNRASAGLEGWIWPSITGDHPEENWQVFDNLVVHHRLPDDEDTAELQDRILDGVSKAWEEATHGIIIGSDRFDRADRDDAPGILAVKRVVDHLGADPSQVFVVLNYRSPRLEQFVSIWHHFWKNHNDLDYHKICEEEQVDHLIRTLKTSMDPLGLAKRYRTLGYNINILDMEGILNNDMDMAHVLACEVMDHTTCKDGRVADKQNKSYQEDYTADKKFDVLNEQQLIDLENFFQGRDCSYQEALEADKQVTILYKDSIWRNCKRSQKAEYKKLADSEYLLEQMRTSYGKCGNVESVAEVEEEVEEEELLDPELEDELEEEVLSEAEDTDDGFIQGKYVDWTNIDQATAVAAVGGGTLIVGLCVMCLVCFIVGGQSQKNKAGTKGRTIVPTEMEMPQSSFKDDVDDFEDE